jgi:hypothetical protein
MAPIGPKHASCVARLMHLLSGRLHGRVVLWPQPDVILLDWRDDFYRSATRRDLDTNTPHQHRLTMRAINGSMRGHQLLHRSGALYVEGLDHHSRHGGGRLRM